MDRRCAGPGVIEEKLVDAERLRSLLRGLRADGQVIVQCHGCFDGLHIGHVRHFRAASQAGDRLIVSVTADEHVNKGPNRPVFGQALRMEFLSELACVDWVFLSHWPSAVPAIELIRPDVFVKGEEYEGQAGDPTTPVGAECAAVRRYGGRVSFTHDPLVLSSRRLFRPRTMPGPLTEPDVDDASYA